MFMTHDVSSDSATEQLNMTTTNHHKHKTNKQSKVRFQDATAATSTHSHTQSQPQSRKKPLGVKNIRIAATDGRDGDSDLMLDILSKQSQSKHVSNLDALEQLQDFEHVLWETKKTVMFLMFATCSLSLINESIKAIWPLYAQKYFAGSTYSIGWVLAAFYVGTSTGSLLFSSMADCFGFSNMAIILVFGSALTIITQGFAQSFSEVSFFCAISGLFYSIYAVNLGFINLLLPHKIAKDYTAYITAFNILFALIGPVLSGTVIGVSANYRYVFFIDGVLLVIVGLIAMFILYGRQAKNLKAQMNVRYIAPPRKESSKDRDKRKHKEREKEKQNRKRTQSDNSITATTTATATAKHTQSTYMKKSHSQESDVDSELDENASHYSSYSRLSNSPYQKSRGDAEIHQQRAYQIIDENEFPINTKESDSNLLNSGNSFSDYLPHLSLWEALYFFSILMQNFCGYATLEIMMNWYIYYMKHRYATSILISSIQLTYCSIFIVIGALIVDPVTECFDKIIDKHVQIRRRKYRYEEHLRQQEIRQHQRIGRSGNLSMNENNHEDDDDDDGITDIRVLEHKYRDAKQSNKCHYVCGKYLLCCFCIDIKDDFYTVNDQIARYFMLVFAVVIGIGCYFMIYVPYEAYFWALLPPAGLFIGMFQQAKNVLLLAVIPPQHSGKLSGFSEFIALLGAALGMVLTGSLLLNNLNWFWYMVSIFSALQVCTVGLMFLIDFIRKYVLKKSQYESIDKQSNSVNNSINMKDISSQSVQSSHNLGMSTMHNLGIKENLTDLWKDDDIVGDRNLQKLVDYEDTNEIEARSEISTADVYGMLSVDSVNVDEEIDAETETDLP